MRLRVILALVVTLALVAGGLWWWLGPDGTRFERAVGLAPADSQRLSWTDWAGIRRDLDSRNLADLLDAGYERDLTSTSALVESAPVLDERFGISPATLDWELFAQSRRGAVVMMGVPEDFDLDALAGRLTELGFSEPAEADGVRVGGPDLLAGIGDLTPELHHWVLLEEEHLVLTSDKVAPLEDLVADLGRESMPAAVTDAVAASGEPLSAAVYTGDHACGALAMSQADPIDVQQADRLIGDAGGVDPYRGFVMARQPGGGVDVVMTFETEEQARSNADARAALAVGAAPGQGGTFGERFDLRDVASDGSVLTLSLDPVGGSPVLSDLSTGPVLFASC